MPAHHDHLAVDGVDRRYPDRSVLREVSLVVPPGERVALVGENGAGKSTLLRLVAGLDEPDAGSVRRPDSLRLVHQVLPFAMSARVGQVLDAAVADARHVEHELTSAAELLGVNGADGEVGAAAAQRYDEALAVAELTDVWSLDARVDAVVEGLGLGGIPRDRLVGQISGGQRSRLALAAALVAHPVALLLDEPTNHLDAAGTEFLAEQMRGWRGPVVFASHDRTFIQEVATRVVDLDPAVGPHRPDDEIAGIQGTAYRGSYTDFLAAKRGARRRWAERYEAEQQERRTLQHEVDVEARQVMHTTVPRSEARASKKFYSDRAATVVARRVRAARTRLAELERRQVVRPPEPLRFAGFASRRAHSAADVLVEVDRAAVPGRLAPTSLTVHGRDRILIDGANGSGKSTLMAVLAGRLAPATGERHARRGVRIGLLAQDVHWDHPDQLVAEVWRRAHEFDSATMSLGTSPGMEGGPAPSLSDTGLVAPRDIGRPVGSLSVGQQRRLALAILAVRPPDILLLDEPTNHLSLGLAEELEAALLDYPGAVVIASHDRWLRARWPGRVVQLDPA